MIFVLPQIVVGVFSNAFHMKQKIWFNVKWCGEGSTSLLKGAEILSLVAKVIVWSRERPQKIGNLVPFSVEDEHKHCVT